MHTDSLEIMFFKLGIRTYTDTYFTKLTGQSPVKIGQDMPKPVGWIYGISIDTDSIYPTDQSQSTISLLQASQIYLYFKMANELFINNMRCDKLIYYNNANSSSSPSTYSNQRRYFPVNIPWQTDLKESYYNNPTGIGGGGNPLLIPLTIYYIDIANYHELLAKGYLHDGAKSMIHHPVHSPTHRRK